MATSDTQFVLHVPSRVCVNPNSISSYPSQVLRAPTISIGSGSQFFTPGVHQFAYSFDDLTALRMSPLSPATSVNIPANSQTFNASFSVFMPPNCKSIYFYMTTSGGSVFYLMGQIGPNDLYPLTTVVVNQTLSGNLDANIIAGAESFPFPITNPTPNAALLNGIAASFPYGGTELGLVKSLVVRGHQLSLPISSEEYGEEKVDLLDAGEDWTVECELRGLDPDAVSAVFPSFSAGPVSGRPDVVYPGTTYRAGTLRSSQALKLLVAPLDTGRHPCWYFPNALPILASDSEEDLQVDKELVIKAFFQGTRDSLSRVFLRRRLEDLTL